MNSEELKNLIESARVEKGISQRELAKLTGISRSTLNDLINGKIKKVDIDDLRKIAETLDMSLQNSSLNNILKGYIHSKQIILIIYIFNIQYLISIVDKISFLNVGFKVSKLSLNPMNLFEYDELQEFMKQMNSEQP